jgi:hypothetical protein
VLPEIDAHCAAMPLRLRLRRAAVLALKEIQSRWV